MSKKYLCPVCGFDGLKEPPFNDHNEPSHEVCPCCGFEFGFDDASSQGTLNVFRKHWIENGAQWFMPNLKPANWDLQKQLKNLNNDECSKS